MGQPALERDRIFCGAQLDAWAWQRGVRLDFIRLGKPTKTGCVESFD